MKDIADCKHFVDTETQRRTLEGLALLWENGPKTIKQAENIMSKVYRFSHLNGSCENKHLDWVKECKGAYKSMQKMGLI